MFLLPPDIIWEIISEIFKNLTQAFFLLQSNFKCPARFSNILKSAQLNWLNRGKISELIENGTK